MNRQPLFVKNIPIDEKRIGFIETVLSRVARNSHKTVTGIITPYPISGYANIPIDGAVLRYMFPTEGEITTGALYIGSMPKSGINLLITIENSVEGGMKSFTLRKNSVKLDINYPVKAGDRLTVDVSPCIAEESISNIWISFLWVPSMKDTHMKQYLLDEVLKLEEANASNKEEIA